MSVFAPTPALAKESGSAAEAYEAARREADQQPLSYLAGDHHIHTQYSSDAMYRVSDQARRAAEFGLDWLVITDHGNATHAKIGVELVNPDIRAARAANPRALIFQGLEWNIPAAEHATVFVAPGDNEVSVLKQFENLYDGSVTGTSDGTPGAPTTPANEALAITGLKFLAEQKKNKVVADALMFANHPARQGFDSPHEIRGWRDAADGIAMGFEGAPGHQAAGIPTSQNGPGSARGFYGGSPNARSFPGYPLESYRTHGGFDWMTATVGGLWDSLLAEGRPWWITANSDAHVVHGDTLQRGPFAPGHDWNTDGRYPNPVESSTPNNSAGDFWPGYYSRTHVGSTRFGYLDVMAGLRAGRVWVDHGHLLDGLDVRLVARKGDELGTALGGFMTVKRRDRLTLTIRIQTASRINYHGDLPKLARVDIIQGSITGEASDRDSFLAPDSKVVQSFDVSGKTGTLTLDYTVKRVERPFYLRIRGTDGKRSAPGLRGAAIDPHGPAIDIVGDGDPWQDLWFYTNPIFVDVK